MASTTVHVFAKSELSRHQVRESKGGKSCTIYRTILYIGSAPFKV